MLPPADRSRRLIGNHQAGPREIYARSGSRTSRGCTKGLEFSRVYIVGVEDAQFTPGERPSKQEIEEARRVLYVGMTRAKDRLVMTRAEHRGGKPTGGTQFLDEMRLKPNRPILAETAAT